jgi:enamine deaminase RidA (YjgF/YER057c/UK114 family)
MMKLTSLLCALACVNAGSIRGGKRNTFSQQHKLDFVSAPTRTGSNHLRTSDIVTDPAPQEVASKMLSLTAGDSHTTDVKSVGTEHSFVVRGKGTTDFSSWQSHGSVMVTSGVVAINNLEDDVSVQTQKCLESIDGILAAAGSNKSRLLATKILLSSVKDMEAVNEVWEKWVDPKNLPARAAYATQLVKFPKGRALVEIEIEAATDDSMIERSPATADFSAWTKHKNVLRTSGNVAIKDLEADVDIQTRAILSVIDAQLKAAGSDKSKLLTAEIYMADVGLLEPINKVWGEWADDSNLPARAAFKVSLAKFPKGAALVEIAITAATGDSHIQRAPATTSFSSWVKHNGITSSSGVVGIKNLEDDVTVQTQKCLDAIDGVLAAAGSNKSKLLTTTILLADKGDVETVNSVWRKWVDPNNLPSRAAYGAELVKFPRGEARVEIMVTFA